MEDNKVNWYRQWKQRRFERQVFKAMLELGLAKAMADENRICVECNGNCEVCEKDCHDCD